MSDKGTKRKPIVPVLTADEWALKAARTQATASPGGQEDGKGIRVEAAASSPTLTAEDFADGDEVTFPAELLPKLIALANAVLPDEDPRKITRAMLAQISNAADRVDGDGSTLIWKQIEAICKALASYLPPED